MQATEEKISVLQEMKERNEMKKEINSLRYDAIRMALEGR